MSHENRKVQTLKKGKGGRKRGKETEKEGREGSTSLYEKRFFMKGFPLGILYIAPLACLKHDLIYNSIYSKSLRNTLVT